MPRPPLVIGTWGRIRRTEIRKGLWVADARYRDHDGVTRQLERTGTTAQKAEDILKEALRDRLTLSGADITAESTVAAVGAVWLESEIVGEKALNTERRYTEILHGVVTPGLGQVRMREISVSRLDRFLKLTTTTRGPATAKVTKTVLSGILGHAARNGAIATNPLRDVATIKQPSKEVLVLELAQLQELRRGMYADKLAFLQDLPEPIDFMLGTGERIGEVLALRWSDLTLDAAAPKAVVRATVVWVNGRGMVLQEFPKSNSSRRELTLPGFLVEMLQKRSEQQRPNELGLVFPSARGSIREPANLRRQWRVLREKLGYEWVVPHTFRKSVATLADDVEKASQQLGHSGTATTKKNYIPKTHVGPDLRDVLDQIAQPTLTPRKQLRMTKKDPDEQRSIGA